MESSPLSDPPSSYPPPTQFNENPTTKKCAQCEAWKPIEEYAGIRDPSKTVALCRSCRDRRKQLARQSNESINALANAQRGSSNIPSPERPVNHRLLTPMTPQALPLRQSPKRKRISSHGAAQGAAQGAAEGAAQGAAEGAAQGAARGATRRVSQLFLPRGRDSQDSPRTAEARAEQVIFPLRRQSISC
jgi:hypothetical protein